MAIVVRVVVEPGSEVTEGFVVERFHKFISDAANGSTIIGGEIVGVNARVDLVPPPEPVDVASHAADEV